MVFFEQDGCSYNLNNASSFLVQPYTADQYELCAEMSNKSLVLASFPTRSTANLAKSRLMEIIAEVTYMEMNRSDVTALGVLKC